MFSPVTGVSDKVGATLSTGTKVTGPAEVIARIAGKPESAKAPAKKAAPKQDSK